MFLVVIWLVDTRYELDLGCVDYHECIVWIPVGNIQFSPVQSLSHVHFFVTPWTTAHQASLSITNSQSPPTPMSIESVMLSNHSTFCRHLLLCPQSFPASGSFPMSQLFSSGDQSIGLPASAPVPRMNIEGWFPLGLTGLISLQFKGLSRVFSSSINFWVLSLLNGRTLTSIHDYWKKKQNIALTI